MVIAVARFIVLLFLVGSAVGGGWYWKTHQKPANSDELTLFGNVDVRQVELAINGNERIAVLNAEEGDHIHKGQLLARLETERLEAIVARAEAMLEAQRQVVARLEAGSRKEEIAKAKADVEAAVAQLADARQTYERTAELHKTGTTTQQEVDDARAAMDAAAARLKSLEAARDLVLAGPRKEDIAEAKAMLKRYEAELAQARHDLKDASLISPCEGIIQDRILEVGDMASPLKPVYLVALVDPVWVRAYVSEPDLGKIHEGMAASVYTDSFPDKSYEGWIGFISPTAEFTPKPVETSELRTKLVYQVRVFVKNPDNELRLGMPATVKIKVKRSSSSSGQTENETGQTGNNAADQNGNEKPGDSGVNVDSEKQAVQ